MSAIWMELRRRLAHPAVIGGLAIVGLGMTLLIMFTLQWNGSSGTWRFVWTPLAICAGSALAGNIWLTRTFPRSAYPSCPACNYDLRGRSPSSTCCPECGPTLDGALAPLLSLPARLLVTVVGIALILLSLASLLFAAGYWSMWQGGVFDV